MQRFNGLAGETRGDGPAVVLIHGGVCADFFAPLMDQPALGGYRLVRYHRAGYGDSPGPPGDIQEQTDQCRRLLADLGIEAACLVGHSSSAAIALQLALDVPALVRSVVLLELALLAVPSGAFAGEAMAHYRDGDRAAAVDTWLRGVGGSGYRESLEAALPGAFDRAVVDADTFFAHELPALRAWTFGPAEAARVTQPALVVLGADSGPAYQQRHQLLLDWLPQPVPCTLPAAGHLMPVQNPGGLADAMAEFLTPAAGAGGTLRS